MKWKNRICGYSNEDPKTLAAHPLNFRVHSAVQTAAIRGAIKEFGVVQNVLVSKRTKRILDGHARIGLALTENQGEIPVTWVDVTEAEENSIIASLDAIGAMADIDHGKLSCLLDIVQIDDIALSDLFTVMMDDAGNVIFSDDAPADGSDEKSKGCGAIDGKKAAKVKAVLAIPEVAIFERAIRLTGKLNRGEAILQICQDYIDANKNTEGQFHI